MRKKISSGISAAEQLGKEVGRPKVAVRPSAQHAGRLLVPHDLINEQVLIAAAAVDAQSLKFLTTRCKPDAFFGGTGDKQHSAIWASFVEIVQRGLEFSPAVVRQVSGGKIDDAYLKRLIDLNPAVPPNLRHHVETLDYDRARVEASRGPLQDFLKLMQDPSTPPDVMRSSAKKLAVAFDGYGDRKHLLDPNELARSQSSDILKRRNGHAVYPYGLDGLDIDSETGDFRLIPGAEPGGITAVTAVSGAGKSTFVARIALGLADLGRKVLFGAWEVKSGNTLELLAAMKLGISRKRMKTGQINDEEHALIDEEMEKLGEYIRFLQMPFGRARSGKVDNDRNLDLIHGYIADSGCQVAIFDLWKRALRQTDPDDEENALVRQQAIAQETNVHCILVQQQRLKDIEQRRDKRPTRDGIKGSSAWVEVPDTILAPHRPALFKRVDDDTLEVVVLKQRDGVWPMAIAFDWNAEYGSIQGGRSIVYDMFDEAAEYGDDKPMSFIKDGKKK